MVFFNNVVYCVMVSYNPDLNLLIKSVKSILANKVKLVIVDNGSMNQYEIKEAICLKEEIEVIFLQKNKGIAFAQNEGIMFALNHGAQFIWLSDQDSIYPDDFLTKMLAAIENLDKQLQDKLGAIGPSFYDTNRGNVQPVVRFSPFFKQFPVLSGLNYAAHIIASGMIIPAQALRDIGLKRDDLFIDWVDTEWCWRATKNGKFIFVNGDVIISHILGDSYVELFGKKVIIRSPFRHYFMIRNELALAIYYRGLPFGARVEMVGRTFIRLLLIPFIAPKSKMNYLSSGAKGLLHGLMNKLGKFK